MLSRIADDDTLRRWAREINDDPTLTVHAAAAILRRIRLGLRAKAA